MLVHSVRFVIVKRIVRMCRSFDKLVICAGCHSPKDTSECSEHVWIGVLNTKMVTLVRPRFPSRCQERFPPVSVIACRKNVLANVVSVNGIVCGYFIGGEKGLGGNGSATKSEIRRRSNFLGAWFGSLSHGVRSGVS